METSEDEFDEDIERLECNLCKTPGCKWIEGSYKKKAQVKPLRKDSSTFTGHSLWGDIDWTLTKYSDYIHVRVELSKNYIHFTFGKHSANF